MYTIYFEILLAIFNWKPINAVNTTNNLKEMSNQYFRKKNLSKTENALKLILKTNSDEPEVLLNLANVLYLQNKIAEAKSVYHKIENSTEIVVAVQTYIHLGLIYCQKGDTLTAITQFENALKKDPKNDIASFNLEALKKALNPKNDLANRKKENEIQKNISKLTENKQTEIDPNSTKTEYLTRLSKINLTENQVKNIFEAISKNDLKYIQQRKVKKNSSNGDYQNW
jgi:tetratricopeptide (TPR) repeat protein